MSVETGELALKEVLEVFVREHDELLHIETERAVDIAAPSWYPPDDEAAAAERARRQTI